MSLLDTLISSCFADDTNKAQQLAQQQISLWDRWLLPITPNQPVGDDPSYEDDFERMKEEVNKLSGADTELICLLAEKLLLNTCKDMRVVTYYIWARLHKEGEHGLADSLGLLAGLLIRYHDTLLPSRATSRKSALEWLSGQRVLDSLSLYPEVDHNEFSRIIALLANIETELGTWNETEKPQFSGLYQALEKRLAQSGGTNSLVPQNISRTDPTYNSSTSPSISQSTPIETIQSGRELLEQSKMLTNYLRNQSHGWLAGHRLMKVVRWDTIHQLPPQDQQGRTRLSPPRTDARAQLKRLYLQQSWGELAEQADKLFAEGVNHFWLDVQWYLYQALSKSPAPWNAWSDIIKNDLKQFLTRLPDLEKLSWEDGTPFADEVTLSWIKQQVMEENFDVMQGLSTNVPNQSEDQSILALETEAILQADNEGIDVALKWLQHRPDISTSRQKWLLNLIMARIAEQFARHDLALNLLRELDKKALSMSLTQWEPNYIFEVKARQLHLFRAKIQRNTSDKSRIEQQMELLLSELTAIDPVRSAILYS
ncbi:MULTISPECIES: type VI secretion system protein TssA [Proteus]|uniref:Type VI secretion system protein TssA n=1 Tax=Proteus penneri TaxID=102862 RepID=A0ABS0W1W1_9GAMM|nr:MULTISPECIES: type VI secretion system protein TssA [Proteus]MBJ2117293.1 type VI secretion system protein TssA [Proteus penneri]NBM13837.1 type VI secretion system protein TssA [Proteus sp. G2670]NBM33204.1 type VI secretion system protein TssA [Proteus sp. G2664]NBM86458.1 type VI secretion system protein TssA [Proteus sp. G2661]